AVSAARPAPTTSTRAAQIRACPWGPTSGSASCREKRWTSARFIHPRSSTCDGGNDRDLVAVLDGRLEVLEEADVLVVREDVDEAAHLAALVADPFLDPGELRFEAGDQRADGVAGRGDLFLPLRQLAKRRRYADGGHVVSSPLAPGRLQLVEVAETRADQRRLGQPADQRVLRLHPVAGDADDHRAVVSPYLAARDQLERGAQRDAAGRLSEDPLGLGEQPHGADDLLVVRLGGPAARADDRLAGVEAVGRVADGQRLGDAGGLLDRLHEVAVLQHHVDDRRAPVALRAVDARVARRR